VSRTDAIDRGLAELDTLFAAALSAAVPNPAALTFSEVALDFNAMRDLLFALGILNEGENEAALIVALARARLRHAPEAAITHLATEAWYYLRTSIDPTWQLNAGEPSIPAILAYLATILRERIAALSATPPEGIVDPTPPAERRALLERLQAETK
jgi:hypothetical protein